MHYTFLSTEALDDLITEGGDHIILEESGEVLAADVIFSQVEAANIAITQTVERVLL